MDRVDVMVIVARERREVMKKKWKKTEQNSLNLDESVSNRELYLHWWFMPDSLNIIHLL